MANQINPSATIPATTASLYDDELADDFMFVNPISSNESDSIQPNYSTAMENLTGGVGSLISPMLLTNSQLESGLLYNQQHQPLLDNFNDQRVPTLFENDQQSTDDYIGLNESKPQEFNVDFKQQEFIDDIETTAAAPCIQMDDNDHHP
ncbi:hypothetical protein BLA29_010199, partial [Euroglyphus maynei]